MKIKTFTISVDELTDILSITDPSVRDAAISAIRSAASDPDSIPETPSGEAAPLLLRIRRKAIARARENERRKERAEAKKVEDNVEDAQPQSPQPTQEPTNARSARIPYTEKLARKFLYLKSNMNKTFDYVIEIIKKFTFGDPRFTSSTELIESIFNRIRLEFAPNFDFATRFMRMPRAEREGISVVPGDIPAQPVG